MSSRIQQMKEKFSGGGGSTPAGFDSHMRSQKKSQEEAIHIARARASRYNLTLRSAAMQQALDNEKAKKDEHKRKKNEKEKMSKPGRRYTASQVKTTVSTQDNVGEALNYHRNPSIAKEFVQAAASHVETSLESDNGGDNEPEVPLSSEAWANVVSSEDDGGAATGAEGEEEGKSKSGEAEAKTEAQTEAKTDAKSPDPEKKEEKEPEGAAADAAVPETSGDGGDDNTKDDELQQGAAEGGYDEDEGEETDPDISKEDAAAEDGAGFEMTELKKALESGDEDQITKATVQDFIREHAPDKVGDVDKLLEEYKGKEHELMKKLLQETKDPAEVIDDEILPEIAEREEAERKAAAEKAEKEKAEKAEKEKQAAEAEAAKAEAAKAEATTASEGEGAGADGDDGNAGEGEKGKEVEDEADRKEEEEAEKEKEKEANVLEQQRREAEAAKKEEEEKLAAMDDEERKAYEEKQAAIRAHNDKKDNMLKQQLNIYSSGGTNMAAKSVLGGGRGRGRGRGRGGRGGRPASGGRATTEYIVGAKAQNGSWSVNPAE